MTRRLGRGLYAITDGHLIAEPTLPDAVEQAILGGAVVIQYREKGANPDRAWHEAPLVAEVCRRHGVPLIVNDDIELAAEIRADGVHLGSDDEGIREARALLGPDALIGISCYDELDRALEAQRLGADYVAFGSFFPSSVKPEAVRAPLTLLREARTRLHVPVVAIGGITPGNGAQLVEAGADLLAVITGVFGAADVRAAAESYRALFAQAHHDVRRAE